MWDAVKQIANTPSREFFPNLLRTHALIWRNMENPFFSNPGSVPATSCYALTFLTISDLKFKCDIDRGLGVR